MSDETAPRGRFRVPDDIEATANVRELYALYGPVFRWAATLTAMLGAFATLLTGTIVNVAIPDVMGALGMTSERAQWLSTGFLAATTVTMLLAAWCVETLGMSRTFILSMVIFLFGSLLGGIATSGDMLIVSRFIQGAGAGLMTPISMLIVFQVFPLHQRGSAMGIFSIGVVLAPATGPVLGGLLIDHLSWRYVFFMAVPFAMISIPMAMVFMPQREPDARTPRFDWTGVILLSIFLVSMLVALSNGPRYGWGSDEIAWLALICAGSGIAFLYWESRVQDPIFNLALFGHGKFLAAAVVTFVIGAGLYGSTYFLPIFMQTVQGLRPTDSGLLLLPAGLVMAVFFPLAGWLSDRTSARRLIIFGLVLFGYSSWLTAQIDTNTPFLDLIIWAVIGRIGLSFIFPCLNAAAMRPLPLELLAQGSGMINFLRQLGGALGVNVMTIYYGQRALFHADHLTQTQTPAPATSDEVLRSISVMVQQIGTTAGHEAALAGHYLGQMIWLQASMFAYRDIFLVIAIVFALSLVPAWFMDSRPPTAIPRPAPSRR